MSYSWLKHSAFHYYGLYVLLQIHCEKDLEVHCEKHFVCCTINYCKWSMIVVIMLMFYIWLHCSCQCCTAKWRLDVKLKDRKAGGCRGQILRCGLNWRQQPLAVHSNGKSIPTDQHNWAQHMFRRLQVTVCTRKTRISAETIILIITHIRVQQQLTPNECQQCCSC